MKIVRVPKNRKLPKTGNFFYKLTPIRWTWTSSPTEKSICVSENWQKRAPCCKCRKFVEQVTGLKKFLIVWHLDHFHREGLDCPKKRSYSDFMPGLHSRLRYSSRLFERDVNEMKYARM